MTLTRWPLMVALCLLCCRHVAAQTSRLSPEANALLRAIPDADKDELESLAASLKVLPADAISLGLRIKAAGGIGNRFAELKLPELARAQYLDAVSMPHAEGASSAGCAAMWTVAMDSLLWQLNSSGETEQVLPTLDRFAEHSTSVCFQASYHRTRTEWMKHLGDAEGAAAYARRHAVELFEAAPDGFAGYELVPVIRFVRMLNADDDALRVALLEKLAANAEACVRDDGGTLVSFHAFVTARGVLSQLAVDRYVDPGEMSQYSDGVDELSEVAIANSTGENAEALKARIRLIVELFKQGQERLKARLVPAEIVGQPAPEISGDWFAETPLNSLAKMRGRVVVLDFWAVWCGPCVASFPRMQRLHEEFAADGLVVVGATEWYGYRWDDTLDKPVQDEEERGEADESGHSREVNALRRFLAQHDVSYPQIVLSKSVTNAYGVEYLPTFVVIDRQGVVRQVFTSASDTTHRALHQLVASLLEEE
ncbi:Thiol-disulfide oxidoreductase ResA [Maioricimonas rarisocia]|uniref:Thiol-disulfide oxidoreductase ResA n=1 Tax=Maioricimonas rarisocia TaxID=2528026 RepID=A0A517ZE91_9PLAN|nr:TlpA disulfide reductase family protein [Maioricimonas rarisocia]QDU40798.1 Thiol-disulfide oxidoreductase ResA [Maioricimonas rarisocia]